MIQAICCAFMMICLAQLCTIRWLAHLFVMLGIVLFIIADWRYDVLKNRIKKLEENEKKGGGSDA